MDIIYLSIFDYICIQINCDFFIHIDRRFYTVEITTFIMNYI